MGRKQKPMPSKDELYHLYIEEHYSQDELAKHYKVAQDTVRQWLLRYNIPLRTRAEAQGNYESTS